MNAGTQTARSAPLSLVAANEDQTQNAGFSADFQDLCSRAMDQALGTEKASLSTVVTLNSCVLDIYRNGFGFAPVFGNLFEIAAQAVACSMELQMNWFSLLAPHSLSHVATPNSRVASAASSQAQPTEEELAHSMDIVIGAQSTAPSSTVTSISAGRAERQAKADGLESGMDIAMGMRKAA
jgi:hypothetical protein